MDLVLGGYDTLSEGRDLVVAVFVVGVAEEDGEFGEAAIGG